MTGPVPRATVIIPTYNQRQHLLRAAIGSALAQWVPVEVLVVDDGSTEPVQAGYGYRVIRHEVNRGVASALNTGIEAASAPWICWLSSDDAFLDRKVDTQLAAMEAGGWKAGFHAYYVERLADAAPVGQALPAGPVVLPLLWNSHREQQMRMADGCFINGSTTCIHRDVFRDVGLYDPSYRYAQDWEMWCRIARRYQWHYVPQILGLRREGDNLTARKNRDPELSRIATEEDKRVRATYGGEA